MNATKKVLKKNEKEKDQQAALTNGGFKFYFCIQPKRYLVLFSIFALVIMPVVLLLLPHRRSYHFLLIATFRVMYNKTRSQTEHTYTHKLVERQKEKHQKTPRKRKKKTNANSYLFDGRFGSVVTVGGYHQFAAYHRVLLSKNKRQNNCLNSKMYFDQKLRFISANCHNDGGG